MPGSIPEGLLAGPLAFDVSDGGRVAVLDQGGARLVLSGTHPLTVPLDFRGLRCRFHGESVIVLGAAGELRTINAAGVTMDDATTHAGAVNLAVMKSGSVVVTFADGDRTLERLGPNACVVRSELLDSATAVAAASGGLWVAGDGPKGPHAVFFRPRAMELQTTSCVVLPANPSAATIGPDGALWLLAGNDNVLRVDAGRVDPPYELPDAVVDLARAGPRLLGLDARGVLDLSALVPPAPGPSPQPDLPACGT